MKTPICISKLYFSLAVLLLLLLPVGQALAADIVVDGDCSLANAIRSANGEEMVEPLIDCEAGEAPGNDGDGNEVSGMDVITIDAATSEDGTITLAETLSVNSEIEIWLPVP